MVPVKINSPTYGIVRIEPNAISNFRLAFPDCSVYTDLILKRVQCGGASFSNKSIIISQPPFVSIKLSNLNSSLMILSNGDICGRNRLR
jgi:hypothetical protein